MHIGEFYWLRTGELLKTKYHTINTCLNAKKNPIYITLRKKKWSTAMQNICLNARIFGTFLLMLTVQDCIVTML